MSILTTCRYKLIGDFGNNEYSYWVLTVFKDSHIIRKQ